MDSLTVVRVRGFWRKVTLPMLSFALLETMRAVLPSASNLVSTCVGVNPDLRMVSPSMITRVDREYASDWYAVTGLAYHSIAHQGIEWETRSPRAKSSSRIRILGRAIA